MREKITETKFGKLVNSVCLRKLNPEAASQVLLNLRCHLSDTIEYPKVLALAV